MKLSPDDLRLETQAQGILAMLMLHAPSGASQQALTLMYHEIQRQVILDHETGWRLVLLKTMIGIFNDGLSHGNWPWSEPNPIPSCGDPLCKTNHLGDAMVVGMSPKSATWGPWGPEGRSGE